MSGYGGGYGRQIHYDYGAGGASSRSGGGNSSRAPPPPTAAKSKQGYSTLTSITNAAIFHYSDPKRKMRSEEEYFQSDDEDNNAADSKPPASSDSEEDPLDAFMAGIDAQVAEKNGKGTKTKSKKEAKGVRDDIEQEDDEESYYRYMVENPNAGLQADDSADEEIEYDEDGNPIVPAKSKYIDPLPAIDHSAIEYEPFEKNFYVVHEEIRSLTEDQALELRAKLGLRVSGASLTHPVSSFGHFGFDEPMMKAIRKMEYTQPTPIQAQGVPTALAGRDIIGIAKTGSGKTAAFVWPMLVHIMDQRELKPTEGPIALILSPTRELSQQIYNEARRFGKVYNIQVVCCYGGGSKWEQSKALESGAEIVVATPGRMIDLVKMKATNLQRVTYLVLDEADKMFNMGFEPQVRSICDHVRPDRQTLMFSATFKKRIEKLARDVLTDPVRIVQGDVGEANTDVTQNTIVIGGGAAKWAWLLSRLVGFTSEGSVLIFVTRKANSEEIANNLRKNDFQLELIHGDIEQAERNRIITAFKQHHVPILVATDVAARGLDISHLRHVINYDVARDIDTHTHRVGRTGRAGQRGTAHTLVTSGDKEFSAHLVRHLEAAAQTVPAELLSIAMQNAWFRKSRFKSGEGKNLNVGGRGLGYRERPGLGSTGTEKSDKNLGGTYGTSTSSSSSASSAVPKSGPVTDRLAAMKEAYRAQYNTTFRAATDTSSQKTMSSGDQQGRASSLTDNQSESSLQPPDSNPRRKKSRWD